MSRLSVYQEEHGVDLDEVIDVNEPVLPATPVGDLGEIDLSQEEYEQISQQILDLDHAFEDFTDCPEYRYIEPAFEIGLEDFADRVEEIWESVKAWIQKVLEWISNNINYMNKSIRVLKFAAENLQARTRSQLRGNSGTGKDLELQTNTRFLSVRYRPIQDASQLVGYLRVYEQQIETYYEYIHKNLLPAINNVSRMIAQMDPTQMDQAEHDRLIRKVIDISPQVLQRELSMAKIMNRDRQWGAPHLLGNQRLVLQRPDEITTDPKVVNSIHLRIQHSELKPRDVPNVVRIKSFGLMNSNQLLERVISLCDTLIDGTSTKSMKSQADAVGEVEKAVQSFVDKVKKLPEDSTTRRSAITGMTTLARTLTDWIHNPYKGFTSSAMTAAKTTLSVVRQNTTTQSPS